MYFNFVNLQFPPIPKLLNSISTELNRLFYTLIQNTISIRMANVVEPKQNTYLNVNR